jgi:hypothetical protein
MLSHRPYLIFGSGRGLGDLSRDLRKSVRSAFSPAVGISFPLAGVAEIPFAA